MAPVIDVIYDEKPLLNPVAFSKDDGSFVSAPVAEHPSVLSHQLVHNALMKQVNMVNHENCEAGEEDSFFVADLGEVFRSCEMWKRNLPRVEAHYAVKCNTDEAVIRLLGNMGCNFDCASKNEIDTVLALGFDSSRIVYANPCKTNSFLRHARDRNVNLTTVDNAQELYKVKSAHPDCRVLLRIATDDESAQCRLSTKFGCSLEASIEELLPLCQQLDVNVVGVAFHVGSGAKDFDSIYKAVRDSRKVFDAASSMGLELTVLDIGGGFERETFSESSAMVNYSLDKFFPATYVAQHGVKFIAEPGRFMVANAFTLATHVIARRDIGTSGIDAMLYINDGVYGNMNCILFDHQHPEARVLKNSGDSGRYVFSIWGPTCDGLDCVATKAALSANVQVGDWLYFANLGAYTSAATTSFNGFSGRANVVYVTSVDLGEFRCGVARYF